MEFRTLKPDEISVRVGSVGARGISLLLYKDARADMTILDETVGCGNWQREHYELKGNLFCRVGIRAMAVMGAQNTPANAFDSWVYKSDCGTESYTEKEKGEASDSFKRACVNWGIGRELYTSPFIFIPQVTELVNGKWQVAQPYRSAIMGAKVTVIEYNGKREIVTLVIEAPDGSVMFSYGS